MARTVTLDVYNEGFQIITRTLLKWISYHIELHDIVLTCVYNELALTAVVPECVCAHAVM